MSKSSDDYLQWIIDVTTPRLEASNYWLSSGGERYLRDLWHPQTDAIAASPEGQESFLRSQSQMRRYLTIAADLMVLAAQELGAGHVNAECVRRGTRALFEIKNFTRWCDGIAFPELRSDERVA